MASLWHRFLANVVDALVVTIATSPLIAIARTDENNAIRAFSLALLIAVYEVFFIGRFGWTPGKRLYRLHVVVDEQSLGPPGYRVSAVRYLVKTGQPLIAVFFLFVPFKIVSNIALFYLFFLLLSLLSSRVNRGIHDKTAKTFVVRTVRSKNSAVAPLSVKTVAPTPRGRKQKAKKKKKR
jgi:uncharacterized RDD family membrane protein YckC